MRSRPITLLYVALLASCLLTLDQVSKALAPKLAQLYPGRFSTVHNDALVLGAGGFHPVWIAAISAALLLAFGGYTLHLAMLRSLHLSVPALLVGGGGGNLVDRVRWGAVQDFILFPGGVIANVADFFVVLGLLLYSWGILRERSLRCRDTTARPAGASAAVSPSGR